LPIITDDQDRFLSIKKVNMEYKNKTKDQLINELIKLYQRISELEKGENRCKLLEIELQTLETRFKIVAEESPNMIFINKKGRVAYVNKRCEEIMGYSRDEYNSENFNFLDLIAPEYKDLVKENFKMHMSGRDIPPYDYKIITKDGREISAIITTKLTEYEGEKAILGIITDITERKKAEKNILMYQSRLEAVKQIGALANSTLNLDDVLQRILNGTLQSLNASAGMIFLKDTETKTLRWGSHTGLSEEFVSEYSDRHIQHGEGLTGRIAQTGEPIYIQRDSSHDPRIARTVIEKEGLNSFIGVPIFAAKDIVCVMNILTRPPEILSKDDVALVTAIGSHVGSAIRNAQLFEARKKAEDSLKKAKDEIESWNRELEERVKEKTEELVKSQEQLFQAEKLSSLGQLAAGLAHELNSPLTGLMSMTRNYRNKAEKDSEEYKHFSLMSNACEYMANIVNDFNTFASKSKGDHVECNLTEIIESSLSLVTNELKLKNIQLNKEYADELPAVKGDKTELQQVVLNIITNSIDAMTDNSRLVIKTGISRDKNGVMMEFIDNGCGIEKKDINKVFEPFFTTKPHGKGTGLGLTVSYAIIKNHGGKITVESEIREETKCTVFLPAVT
jgi:PAS domain S-box-containing protein